MDFPASVFHSSLDTSSNFGMEILDADNFIEIEDIKAMMVTSPIRAPIIIRIMGNENFILYVYIF